MIRRGERFSVKIQRVQYWGNMPILLHGLIMYEGLVIIFPWPLVIIKKNFDFNYKPGRNIKHAVNYIVVSALSSPMWPCLAVNSDLNLSYWPGLVLSVLCNPGCGCQCL